MIPLRDINPHRTTPFINYIIIGGNVIIFLFQFLLSKHYEQIIYTFGIVPVRLMTDVQTFNFDTMTFLPLFTSMFMHGGWLHLIGNMLFLYVFGDNIEDRLGHLRYLLFYLLAGLGAAFTQIFINPVSQIPMVGASGAIAGVLGAYILLFPTARILTLIPIFFFIQLVELPAYLFLGIWFIMQLVSGMLSLGIGADAGGVAWWAHIGGFATGAVLLVFLKRRR
ncbi:MAG: rhomboid family intramembrane serine protease [Bacteroidetes bacterium]|nr:rhomboid family intramembrane serine protease [Bacteroidota bacterium]MBU1422152.1 rhomboid family intramembrane serine protease [Bacteroidota bacterium]MBU2447615.1 rhomboid family intramembrane serine protease [Bacteroidota bacterium]